MGVTVWYLQLKPKHFLIYLQHAVRNFVVGLLWVFVTFVFAVLNMPCFKIVSNIYNQYIVAYQRASFGMALDIYNQFIDNYQRAGFGIALNIYNQLLVDG